VLTREGVVSDRRSVAVASDSAEAHWIGVLAFVAVAIGKRNFVGIIRRIASYRVDPLAFVHTLNAIVGVAVVYILATDAALSGFACRFHFRQDLVLCSGFQITLGIEFDLRGMIGAVGRISLVDTVGALRELRLKRSARCHLHMWYATGANDHVNAAR